jgi:hypothetical protein
LIHALGGAFLSRSMSAALTGVLWCSAQRNEYEGTSHFSVTASSAKIGVGSVNLKPSEGEAP